MYSDPVCRAWVEVVFVQAYSSAHAVLGQQCKSGVVALWSQPDKCLGNLMLQQASILVVDDNPVSSETLTRSLVTEGCEITHASCTSDALMRVD